MSAPGIARAPAPGIVAVAPSRILELDGLRAFAILPVILHHSWPKGSSTGFLGEAGWMGVDLFFVLSGYLITGILLKTVRETKGYRNFLIRRSLRIFPLYYLCLALFAAVAFARQDPWAAMKDWGGVGWFVVYLGNIRAAWVNHLPPVLSFATLWSLQVEEQFYLFFPIAVMLFSTRNLKRFLIACIVAAPALRSFLVLFVPHSAIAGYALMPCRMDALAMGGLLAVAFRSGERPRAAIPRLAFLIGGAASAAIFWAALLRQPEGTANDPWMRAVGYSAIDFTCASLLYWVLVSPASGLSRILRWRALVYTGQIAYGLYLLHEPASWTARKLLGNVETHSALSVPITLVASFVAAALSWRFFESPFLAWKERFQMRESGNVRLSRSQASP
jgi:peptidoglycan/LPS O-acetylase OafA/YrhL